MAKSRARKLADIIVGAGIDIDGNLTFDGGSTSADLTFADNDKANFGDASDLQIYHDGSNSYIKDAGTGDLIVEGSNNIWLMKAGGSEVFLNTYDDGAVQLYHDNSVKFATTSTGIDVTGVAVVDGLTSSAAITSTSNSNSLGGTTFTSAISGTTASMSGSITISGNSNTIGGTTFSSGIDVTGTVTADGLTVDGAATIGSSTAKTKFYSDSTYNGIYNGSSLTSDESIYMGGDTMFFYASGKKRLDINAGGDISFYEDTGTDAKLFWDASTERLGLGTTTPTQNLDIRNSGSAAAIKLRREDTSDEMLILIGSSYGYVQNTTGPLGLGGSGGDRDLFIATSGNVGIGTTSPGTSLHIANSSNSFLTLERTSPASGTGKFGINIEGNSQATFAYDNSSKIVIGRSSNPQTQAGFSNDFAFDSSGNFGIGTTSPALQSAGTGIHINASSYSEIKFTNSTTGTTASDGTALVSTGNDFQINNRESGNLKLRTSNADALTINSSGNVGINSSNPSTGRLVIPQSNSAQPAIHLPTDESTIQGPSANTQIRMGGNLVLGSAAITTLSTNGAERMRIDASGNVGIGTTSPATELHVDGKILTAGGSASSPALQLNDVNSGLFSAGGNTVAFSTDGSEAMRIDSSGNLLVGKTTANTYNNTNGIELFSSGLLTATRTGIAQILNREDSDGDIAVFRKDGTTVGSIGNFYGYMYLGTEDTGLIFDDDNSHIKAWNPSTNGGRDAAVDLGASGTRFKDVYMSGGLKLRHSASGQIHMTRIDSTIGVNNSLGQIVFGGSEDNGTTINDSASIVSLSSQSHSSTRSGGHLTFSTTANHTTTLTERMRIDSSGVVGINTTATNNFDGTPSLIVGSGSGDSGIAIYTGSSSAGYLQFGDGTSGAEEYRGFIKYDHSANSMSFNTNGTGRSEAKMTLDSSGNLGIGTAAPQSKIEVNLHSGASSSLMDANTVNDVQLIRAGYSSSAATTSNAGAKWGLRFVGRNDSNYDNQKSGAIYAVSEDSGAGYNRNVGLAFHTSGFDSNHAERMRIDSSGNVGIGTASPAVKLDISESYDNTFLKLSYSSSDSGAADYAHYSELLFQGGGSYNKAGVRSYSNAYSTGNAALAFWTQEHAGSYAERMRIIGNGNVGIGTTSPSEDLHVSGTGDKVIAVESTSTGAGANAGIKILAADGGDFLWQTGNVTGNALRLYDLNGNAERMRIDASGNVGIGVSSIPSWANLITNGTVAVGGILYMKDTQKIQGLSGFPGGASNLILNPDGGNVGIGTTSPGKLLTLSRAAEAQNEQLEFRNVGGISNGNFDGIKWTQGATGGTMLAEQRINYYSTGVVDMSFNLRNEDNVLYLKAGGNVGIGTTNPGSKLQIQTSHTETDVTAANSNSTLNVANSGSGNGVYNAIKFAANQQDMYIMSFNNNQQADRRLGFFLGSVAGDAATDERLSIRGNGYVGIGTTSPITKTHISHSTVINDHHGLLYVQNTASATGSSSNAGINVNNYTGTSQFMQWENHGLRIGSRRLFNGGAGDVVFTAGADSEKMRIQGNGYIGINTTAPTETLTVHGAICSKNGYDDLGTHTTNSHASVNSSGTLEFTIGYTGTLASGRVLTFTYEATSWKSWIFEIEVASTHRLTTIKSGGYNNSSMSNYVYELGDTANAGTLTVTNSGQHNVFTFTVNSAMTHPLVRVKYTQSGGDGAPRTDRMKLVIT